MTPEQPRNTADERALDEMAAALRDAGDEEPLPPELRRRALEALWVADAARYEGRSARNATALRRLTALAALVVLGCVGAALVLLVRRAVYRENERIAHFNLIHNATPPATTPTTGPATAPASAPQPAALPTEVPAVVLRGRVTFSGTAPSRPRIDLSAVRECQSMHPGGLEEESLVVGPRGGIANVVVSLRPGHADFSPPPPSAAAAVGSACACWYMDWPMRLKTPITFSEAPFRLSAVAA